SRYSCQCAATGAAGIGLRAGNEGSSACVYEKQALALDKIMELQIERVGKRYSGDKWALRDFSLKMGPGILGLLGPNGAGKTTLMSIIATITRPTEGTLHWNGSELAKDPNAIRTVLGYLPQDFGGSPHLTAVELLQYLAAVK